MPTEIVVPQVGEAVSEVTIVEWLKKPGDRVKKGEVLFLVDTDKATVEVEAFMDGILTEITAPEGSQVLPQQVIGKIKGEGENGEGQEAAGGTQNDNAQPNQRTPQVSPLAARMAAELNIDLDQVAESSKNKRVTVEDVRSFAASHQQDGIPETAMPAKKRAPASPKARALAKELGVEVDQLTGTGYAGFITTQDVRRAAEGMNEPRPKEIEPLHPPPPSRRRQAIAQKMQKSKQTVPHFYLMVDVNMSQAQRLRAYCTETLGWKRPPTYTGMFIRACALTLASMPEVNAIYQDQGSIPRDTIEIGVVVGMEDGLLVPVVSQADHLTLEETSRHLNEIADRARSGKLREAQLGQKSMVVSNLGMYGVDAFIAIIDIPDPMILAVGRITDRVVPFNGQPAIAPYCTLTLSADHRALDGISGSKFLSKVASYIENPYELLR